MVVLSFEKSKESCVCWQQSLLLWVSNYSEWAVFWYPLICSAPFLFLSLVLSFHTSPVFRQIQIIKLSQSLKHILLWGIAFPTVLTPFDITDWCEFFSRSCSSWLTDRPFPDTQIMLQHSESRAKSRALCWGAPWQPQAGAVRPMSANTKRLRSKFGFSLASGEGSLPPVGSEQHPQHCAPAKNRGWDKVPNCGSSAG